MTIRCTRCKNDDTLAAWLVTAPGRQEVACGAHLEASEAWARIAGAVTVVPVTQPAGAELHAPPGATQPSLFDDGGPR